MASVKERVEQTRSASWFRFGDASSFSVPVGEGLSLPGATSPGDYLDLLGMYLVDHNDVIAVICPGNGGLIYELVMRGAKKIIAFEPRHLFRGVVERMLAQFPVDCEVEVRSSWPVKSDGPCSCIIWSEGVSDIGDPETVLPSVAAMLSVPGNLFIETVLGLSSSGISNNWRPTETVLSSVLRLGEAVSIDLIGQGRRENSVIHRVAGDFVVLTEDAPEPPKKRPAKKKKAARKQKKVSDTKIKDVADITGMSEDHVRQEVAAWGPDRIEQLIKDAAG